MSYIHSAPGRQTRTIYTLSMTAVMTAVICVLAPMSIPIGPVPITLTNLAIYLSVYLLGWKHGTISYLVYLLIGLAGMPVFSGFSGGLTKLAGPTGGYIIGFLPLALLSGLFIQTFRRRALHLVGMLIGTAACYIFGTAWFCIQSSSEVIPALALCVIPFLPFDLAKILLSMAAGPMIRQRLYSAGLLH